MPVREICRARVESEISPSSPSKHVAHALTAREEQRLLKSEILRGLGSPTDVFTRFAVIHPVSLRSRSIPRSSRPSYMFPSWSWCRSKRAKFSEEEGLQAKARRGPCNHEEHPDEIEE